MIHEISELSVKHNFLIFEDRKFADIGNTVRLQYQNGPFKISSWTDMANFHIIPGPGVLDGLIAANSKTDRAFIVLSQMSSKGSMMTDEYSKESIRLAENHPNDVIGFICQNKQSSDPRFLHMTPGVSLINSSDSFGQQYRSPERAIVQDGCDIIIVGRGIIESNDMVSEAVKYKNAAWNAHLASLNPKEKRIYEPA
jgi:uridine monophosphate synthetase